MTKRQKTAVKNLEKALKECKRAGVYLSGMDSSLLYCTQKAYKWAQNERSDKMADYNHVAYCHYQNHDSNETGSLEHYGCYVDSGGF